MSTMRHLWRGWLGCLAATATLLMGAPSNALAQPGATVVYIAGERLTDITLGYRHAAQAARLGFGTVTQPWHTWFGGGTDVRSLVHLPGFSAGQAVKIEAPMLIGNRFAGKTWPDGFAALASFDRDGNGLVEGREMKDLYVWVDFDGNGTIANREDALRPASFYYTGFDLRSGAQRRVGPAREGRLMAFSVMVPYATRNHLLEMDVSASAATRHEAYLAPVAARSASRAGGATAAAPWGVTDHPLNGTWRWQITNAQQWKDPTRPWGKDAGGLLMLAASQDRITGLVRMMGPHEDRINLPLQGQWREGRAHWTSESPMGLTRSEVRLDSLYGRPLLRGRSWSNRNGKVTEWTWEARHEQALD